MACFHWNFLICSMMVAWLFSDGHIWCFWLRCFVVGCVSGAWVAGAGHVWRRRAGAGVRHALPHHLQPTTGAHVYCWGRHQRDRGHDAGTSQLLLTHTTQGSAPEKCIWSIHTKKDISMDITYITQDSALTPEQYLWSFHTKKDISMDITYITQDSAIAPEKCLWSFHTKKDISTVSWFCRMTKCPNILKVKATRSPERMWVAYSGTGKLNISRCQTHHLCRLLGFPEIVWYYLCT